MDFYRFSTIFFSCFLVIMTNVAFAHIPGRINFQGQLTNAVGSPVADGDYQMRFYLYDSKTEGIQLWNGPDGEEQTVTIAKGMYNVQLGAVQALTPAVLDQENVWLEVAVHNPDSAAWETLSPRILIAAAAYALKAGDADTLGGHDSSAYDQSSHLSDTKNPHNVTAAQTGATDTGAFNAHTGDASAHHAKTTRFAELTGDIADDSQIPPGITRDEELNAGLAGKSDAGHTHDTLYYTKAQVDSLVSTLRARIQALEDKLANVTKTGNDMIISGVNVHIVNGTGTTDGTVNRLGNLIVGYNELRGSGDDRGGSHNIVVGSRHNFTSYGGLVAGYQNTISNAYASVSGGSSNTASGHSASVSGGYANLATNYYASVSGGSSNTASGERSSVSGGSINQASGDFSSISGGSINKAIGFDSSVSGGIYNQATGNYSSLSGGYNNRASGVYASITGGKQTQASGECSSVSGGYDNAARGNYSSVSGGTESQASGDYASVSGGSYSNAMGNYSSVSGGRGNWANHNYSQVAAGHQLQTDGDYDFEAQGVE